MWTNSNLIAPKNYESVGFILYDTKENNDEPAFSGDYLYYKIQFQSYERLKFQSYGEAEKQQKI